MMVFVRCRFVIADACVDTCKGSDTTLTSRCFPASLASCPSIRLQGLRTNGNGDRARPPTLQLQQLQDQLDAAMAKKRESDPWTR